MELRKVLLMFTWLRLWIHIPAWIVLAGVPAVAQESPRTSGGRTAAMIGNGMVSSVVGASLGALAGSAMSDGRSRSLYPDPAVFVGGLIGYYWGLTYGVTSVGETETSAGRPWPTFAGAAAGSLVGVFVPGGFLFGGPVGATMGYNLSRRYKAGPPKPTTWGNGPTQVFDVASSGRVSPFADTPYGQVFVVHVVRMSF